MYIRKNIPEIGEFVIGTVESTKSHHVIFKLDEYNLNADLYTTEINRKEVRNFKVVFKKNRKFVLKVIKSSKSGINLSLRKVGSGQERAKQEEYRNEKIADELINQTSKQLKIKYSEFFKKTGDKILEKYDLIYPLFQESIDNPDIIDFLKLTKKNKDALISNIKSRISVKEKTFKYNFNFESTKSNGILVVKNTVKKIFENLKNEKVKLEIKYMGPGKYRFNITPKNNKKISKIIDIIEKTLRKNLTFLGVREIK